MTAESRRWAVRTWLGRGVDAVEAPLPVEVLLIGWWSVARILERQDLMGVLLVVGGLVALRWPGTGMSLACLAFLFPIAPGFSEGAVLLGGAAIGCLIAAARSDISLHVYPAIVFAGALAITTGLALLRLIGGPLAEGGAIASERWAGLVIGLASIPVYLFLVRAGARRALIVLAGAVAVAVGLGLVDGLWPGTLDSTRLGRLLSDAPSDRANGPFPGPNRLGTVAAMTAAAAAVLARASRGWWRTLLAFGATIATITVLATFSRGALLGLSVAVVVLIARRDRRLAAIAAVVAALVVFLVAPAFMDARLQSAPVSSGRPAEQAANDAQRFDAWKAGLRMGAAQPVAGHGYGSFALVGADFGGPKELQTAHNETIGLFAEVGLPGALSYAGLIIACLWAFRRGTVAHDLGLAAVLVFATASSFNIQSIYPQVTILLWALVAVGLALGSREQSQGEHGDADGRARSSD